MHAMKLDNTNPKATVPFNFKEKPIGDPSVQLESCLGVLVQRNIPLTFKDWRVVPHQAKANIWKISSNGSLFLNITKTTIFPKWEHILKNLDLGKPVWYSRLWISYKGKKERKCLQS